MIDNFSSSPKKGIILYLYDGLGPNYYTADFYDGINDQSLGHLFYPSKGYGLLNADKDIRNWISSELEFEDWIQSDKVLGFDLDDSVYESTSRKPPISMDSEGFYKFSPTASHTYLERFDNENTGHSAIITSIFDGNKQYYLINFINKHDSVENSLYYQSFDLGYRAANSWINTAKKFKTWHTEDEIGGHAIQINENIFGDYFNAIGYALNEWDKLVSVKSERNEENGKAYEIAELNYNNQYHCFILRTTEDVEYDVVESFYEFQLFNQAKQAGPSWINSDLSSSEWAVQNFSRQEKPQKQTQKPLHHDNDNDITHVKQGNKNTGWTNHGAIDTLENTRLNKKATITFIDSEGKDYGKFLLEISYMNGKDGKITFMYNTLISAKEDANNWVYSKIGMKAWSAKANNIGLGESIENLTEATGPYPLVTEKRTHLEYMHSSKNTRAAHIFKDGWKVYVEFKDEDERSVGYFKAADHRTAKSYAMQWNRSDMSWKEFQNMMSQFVAESKDSNSQKLDGDEYLLSRRRF